MPNGIITPLKSQGELVENKDNNAVKPSLSKMKYLKNAKNPISMEMAVQKILRRKGALDLFLSIRIPQK